jgi:uncharacterized protein (DUF4415 family)
MEELNEKVKREGTLSNWEAFDAMTEDELEASIDYEEEGMPIWESLRKGSGLTQPQQEVTMLLDGEVIDWFKAQGGYYLLRMNAVLRNYVEDQKEKARAK